MMFICKLFYRMLLMFQCPAVLLLVLQLMLALVVTSFHRLSKVRILHYNMGCALSSYARVPIGSDYHLQTT